MFTMQNTQNESNSKRIILLVKVSYVVLCKCYVFGTK